MNKRNRTPVILAVISCVAVAGYLATGWPSLNPKPIGPPQNDLPRDVDGGSEPVSGHFVGHPESRIVEQFGPPIHRWPGHYGNPPVSYRRTYADAFTVTYDRPTGTLYLSYCQEQGRLVCFSSNWLPAGMVF